MTTRNFGQTFCAFGIVFFLCMPRMLASAEEIIEEPLQVDEQVDEQVEKQFSEDEIIDEVLPDIIVEESVDEGIIDENVLVNTGASDHDAIEEESILNISAYGTCGPNLTWSLSDDETVLTISGTGQMDDYDYASPWYNSRRKINRVILRNGLTSIGNYAFYGCTSLINITIPNTVTSIGEGAFYDCRSLAEIAVPNSVARVGKNAFYYCGSLTSITIPNSVTSIGDYAFYYCGSLTGITIPNSVTSIGDGAFSKCSSLTSITIPNSLTSIGYRMFSECTSMASVTIPNTVTSIGDYAFSACTSLKSITIPNSVASIGLYAFSGCTGLVNITIPNSVTNIGWGAFSDCTSLTSITLPNSIKSMGGTFSGCTGLTSITIPDSVISIGDAAFFGCTNLTELNLQGILQDIGAENFSGCSRLKRINGWSVYFTMTTILSRAFQDASALTELYVPKKVTTIKDYAFWGCNSLTRVGIPAACTKIETGAFRGCPITDVFYEGTREQWNAIAIGSYNDALTNARIHFNSNDVYPIDATGVVLNQSEMELTVGNTDQLVATVQPENAGMRNVSWMSGRPDVATVDENGNVTALSVGSTYIRVTTVDGSFSSECWVTVSPADPVVVFVTRMYQVALGRNPRGEEANGWVDDLKNGRKTGADIAQGFYMSPEIFSNNPTSEEYVELAYQGMMNRPSDAGGKADWVEALNSGVTCNAIIRGFVGSQEFRNLCADYGIQPGEVTVTEPRDQNVGITKFVARLYTQALGRPYDVGGLNDWTAQINANPSKENILRISTNGFLNSQEFLSKNLSNEEFVRVLYRTFLDREADQDGLNDWLNRMANGYTRDDVAAGFANSPEFAAIMARYGL